MLLQKLIQIKIIIFLEDRSLRRYLNKLIHYREILKIFQFAGYNYSKHLRSTPFYFAFFIYF
jgi:hypothetical protein